MDPPDKKLPIKIIVVGRKPSSPTTESVSASETSVQYYSCTACRARFSSLITLTNHTKLFHMPKKKKRSKAPSIAVEKNVEPKTFRPYSGEIMTCTFCDARFKYESTMEKHIKDKHDPSKKPYRKLNKCLEGCETYFKSRLLLIEHLATRHRIETASVELIFENFDQFNKWKDEMEQDTCSKYVVKRDFGRGQERGKRINLYYTCGRSGRRNMPRVKPNSCHKRPRESKKADYHCTSFMKVTIKENCLQVFFSKTHYGHDTDINDIGITRETKFKIERMIAAGHPNSVILRDIKRDSDSPHYRRNCLLAMKDIRNVENRFRSFDNVSGKKVKSDDNTRLDTLLEELNTLEDENPIRFFDKQFESQKTSDKCFVMVIMTQTQKYMLQMFPNVVYVRGMTRCDYDLTTLFVFDELNRLYPVAFLLANRKDSAIYELFFEKIKETAGVVNLTVLLTDTNERLHQAWAEAMGEVHIRMFCPWDVADAWKKGLAKVSQSKRDETLNVCLDLMNETDPMIFHEKMDGFLSMVERFQILHKFGEYFEECFKNNIAYWAHCYTPELKLNCQPDVEAFYDSMKNDFLEKKKLSRMHKIIRSLFAFIKFKDSDRVKTLSLIERNHLIRNILSRHKMHLSMSLTMKKIDYKEWQMWSVDNYVVRKVLNQNCCDLVCTKCFICVHRYTCTCADSLSILSICKHIHFVVSNIGLIQTNLSELNAPSELCEQPDAECLPDMKDLVNKNLCTLSEIAEFIKSEQVDQEELENAQTVLETLLTRIKEKRETVMRPILIKRIVDSTLHDHAYLLL